MTRLEEKWDGRMVMDGMGSERKGQVGKEKAGERRKNRGGNTKRTGELSEAAFLLKAKSMGYKVSKPWGDSERYDFVVDSGDGKMWRVQVKCTAYERAGGYDIQPIYTDRTRKAAYTAKDIDVLVAHIIPLDVWYVLPIAALGMGKSLRFYPEGGCKRARFEKYREAWEWFEGKVGSAL